MSKAYERLEQQVGEEKAELMIHYMDEILRMNEHINLTAVRDPEEFIVNICWILWGVWVLRNGKRPARLQTWGPVPDSPEFRWPSWHRRKRFTLSIPFRKTACN